jgi:hypoxanthine phosphoribosyltransferase
MSLTEAMLRQIRDEAVMLHGPEAVAAALDRMAGAITAALDGTLPIVLCVLNGGIIPIGHLLTRLSFPLETDYLHATRYRGKTTGDPEIAWVCKPHLSLQGRTVLLVDDILDEGHTLKAIGEYCRRAGAARVYTAVLVEKPARGRHDGGLRRTGSRRPLRVRLRHGLQGLFAQPQRHLHARRETSPGG